MPTSRDFGKYTIGNQETEDHEYVKPKVIFIKQEGDAFAMPDGPCNCARKTQFF